MSAGGSPTEADAPGLRRDIGFTGSAFLAFNGIVGAGIFALPATLHGQFGAFSPWLFPLFALAVLLVVLPFARLAALFPTSGGPAAYTAVFGPVASFQVGWLYYLTRVTALAANANVFAIYAAALWPPLGTAIGRIATIALLIGALTLINVAGVRRAIRALDALTLLKALPLVALAVFGLIWSAHAVPPPGPPPSLSAIEATALVVLYAFVGFENSVVPAGETRDPERNIPRALIATVVATAAIYFLVQLAYVAVMPAGAAPDAPLAAFAEALIGPVGAVLLSLTALASVAGNVTGSLTSTPRVTYALAQGGLLPCWFGRVSARFATPANSVLFMGLLGFALAVTGSFVWLAIVSTLARLFVYGASIAALPANRRRAGLATGIGTFALIGAGLALCVWAAMQSRGDAWAMLGGLVALGLLLFLIARRQAASSAAASVSAIQPPPSTRSPS
ncbi:APC family permease [Sphingosinicella sp. LHD-64]|uniref:APC family permease n=1 Tax=Sphingosinicella sp. LHD-64 TaxID=3072139 RepID=UPI00280D9D8A|nr:APC family permease [Sphingosinicella sp. LHD-64]MDQ8756052.1 APC family permease [Sphingosinicella sp. LHD-64]